MKCYLLSVCLSLFDLPLLFIKSKLYFFLISYISIFYIKIFFFFFIYIIYHWYTIAYILPRIYLLYIHDIHWRISKITFSNSQNPTSQNFVKLLTISSLKNTPDDILSYQHYQHYQQFCSTAVVYFHLLNYLFRIRIYSDDN